MPGGSVDNNSAGTSSPERIWHPLEKMPSAFQWEADQRESPQEPRSEIVLIPFHFNSIAFILSFGFLYSVVIQRFLQRHCYKDALQ